MSSSVKPSLIAGALVGAASCYYGYSLPYTVAMSALTFFGVHRTLANHQLAARNQTTEDLRRLIARCAQMQKHIPLDPTERAGIAAEWNRLKNICWSWGGNHQANLADIFNRMPPKPSSAAPLPQPVVSPPAAPRQPAQSPAAPRQPVVQAQPSSLALSAPRTAEEEQEMLEQAMRGSERTHGEGEARRLVLGPFEAEVARRTDLRARGIVDNTPISPNTYFIDFSSDPIQLTLSEQARFDRQRRAEIEFFLNFDPALNDDRERRIGKERRMSIVQQMLRHEIIQDRKPSGVPRESFPDSHGIVSNTMRQQVRLRRTSDAAAHPRDEASALDLMPPPVVAPPPRQPAAAPAVAAPAAAAGALPLFARSQHSRNAPLMPEQREWSIRSGDIARRIQTENTRAQSHRDENPGAFQFVEGELPTDAARRDTITAEEVSVGSYRVGIAHYIGRRAERGLGMEDEHIALQTSITINNRSYPIQLFGVFDGHGGRVAACLVRDRLADTITRFLRQFNPTTLTDEGIWNALKISFVELHRQYRDELPIPDESGTTACVAMILDGKLWVANVGDSRAVLAQANGDYMQLSEDASLTPNGTADSPWSQAAQRYERGVTNRGGVVYFNAGHMRINGSLMTARAIGDKHLIGANSSRPKITMYPLSQIRGSRLAIACDGVFDVASSRQVTQAVHANRTRAPGALAKNLIVSAYRAGSGDNLSALVIPIG